MAFSSPPQKRQSCTMNAYRAASLFQPSNLVKAMERTMDPSLPPSYLYGSIMAFPHTMVARTIATMGMDFVMVDALHTAIDAENLVRIIHTINFCSEGKTVAVVRVPSAHSSLLTHALDAGAAGIVFPHIDTPEEAAQAVSKCRYASTGGTRSLSPCALIAGVTDLAPPGSSHALVADAHIAVICQIESPLALENAAAIAAVPGVNSLMLGPGDLRLSLGLPSQKVGNHDDPKFLAAIDHLVAVSQRFCMPLMTVAFKISSKEDSWITKFSLLLTTADFINVVRGHQADLRQSKNLVEELLRSQETKTKTNGEGHTNGEVHVNGEVRVNGWNNQILLKGE